MSEVLIPFEKRPLFQRFINKELTDSQLHSRLLAVLKDSGDEHSVSMVEGMTPSVSKTFREDFKYAVQSVISDGLVGSPVPQFLTMWMSAIGVSTIKSGAGNTTQERSTISILSENFVLEGFLSYNFTMYLKGFGLTSLKCCPTCSSIFTHKGKYGKYCSVTCKQ